MAAEPQDFPMEGVPGTPGIREVRPESSSENFRFCTTPGSGDSNPGIRRVSLRAEIDTSPPFGSVKEAVTRFGGSGPWLPLYKFGEAYQGIEEFDIKRVEEQAAELEKDLIVKELETLDVLEELGTTKRIVEELKRQLQSEALKCMNTPDTNSSSSTTSSSLDHEPAAIKEMNKEHDHDDQCEQQMMNMMRNCPVSSPDLILMELKQAKLNLGKTINDLGVIQTSVESLNKKMKKEKILLEKTRERLTCNHQFPGIVSNVEANNSSNTVKQQPFHNNIPNPNPKPDQLKKMVEVPRNKQPCLKTAEMRLVAAKKMEEAARAAEALALIEMNSLTGIKAMSSSNDSGFSLPEPDQYHPFPRTPKPPRPSSASAFAQGEEVANKKVINAMHKFAEANISKLAILRKLEEASEEVKHSKEALEEALNRVEIASRKQLDAEEALRRWIPNHDHEHKKHVVYNAPKINNFNQNFIPRSPLHDLNNKNPTIDDEAKPVLRPTVSMRDILSRKQVSPEDCVVMKRPNNEGHTNTTHERQKVALSQMLHELREDFTFPSKPEQKDIHGGEEQKQQFFSQRRKFGFIHISLPLAKQSKKKSQALNNNVTQ